MAANEKQVGGNHYKTPGHEEHWDRAWRLQHDPFQYQVTKYVERWRKKNGIEDLRKARHFLDKYIELLETVGDNFANSGPGTPAPYPSAAPEDGAEPGRGYVDQDRGSPETRRRTMAAFQAAEKGHVVTLEFDGDPFAYPEPGALRRKAVAKRKKRKAAKR